MSLKEKVFFAGTLIAAFAGFFCFAGDFVKGVQETDIIENAVPQQVKDSAEIFTKFEEVGNIVPDIQNTYISEEKVPVLDNIDDTGTVVRIVDGDTYVIDINGTEYKVRLIGVDTPESAAPDDYRKDNTEEGRKISDIVKEKIKEGDILFIEYDTEKTDRYGRTLAYLYFEDGTMIQDWLLENGYANIATYPPNVKYAEHFADIAHTAMENKVGLWNGYFKD